MSAKIDIGILELLASKICHDLISPIGAIHNGLEIIDEMGDGGKEVTDLIAFSATQASAKLQAFRMAYGAGGADTSIKPEEVHKSIEAIVGAEKKIRQTWEATAPLGPMDRPKGFSKILICALLLAMESLPKGGTISAKNGSSENEVIVKAEGENAGFREGIKDALTLKMPRERLEPKFVHAYVTGLNAANYGFSITAAEETGRSATITITAPAG